MKVIQLPLNPFSMNCYIYFDENTKEGIIIDPGAFTEDEKNQIKKVIDELKNIPVIILSGKVNKSNMLAAMENGADKVIIKPFNIDDLISAVNELLGYDLERKINPDVQSINFHDDVVNDLQKIFIESFPSQKKYFIK